MDNPVPQHHDTMAGLLTSGSMQSLPLPDPKYALDQWDMQATSRLQLRVQPRIQTHLHRVPYSPLSGTIKSLVAKRWPGRKGKDHMLDK